MRQILFAALFSLVCLGSAQASLVYGLDASDELVGSRDIYDGITATGGWEDNFSIAWNIEQEGDHWVYQYYVSGDKDISHLILEVTKDVNIEIFSQLDFEGPKDFDWGRFGQPNDIFGVKFDDFGCEGSCVTFTTNRSPVYGNFFAKSGFDPYSQQWTTAFNNGLVDSYSGDILDFIVRPNGDFVPVPEPTTMAMMGFGLVGLGLSSRRRKTAV